MKIENLVYTVTDLKLEKLQGLIWVIGKAWILVGSWWSQCGVWWVIGFAILWFSKLLWSLIEEKCCGFFYLFGCDLGFRFFGLEGGKRGIGSLIWWSNLWRRLCEEVAKELCMVMDVFRVSSFFLLLLLF